MEPSKLLEKKGWRYPVATQISSASRLQCGSAVAAAGLACGAREGQKEKGTWSCASLWHSRRGRSDGKPWLAGNIHG